jgi:MFS family permease
MNTSETQNYTILGQKYAYATISLILGIVCFVNLAGMEKAVLAIIFGWLALRTNPLPALNERRLWAQVGLILGALVMIIVPLVIILNLEQLRELIEALSKIGNRK